MTKIWGGGKSIYFAYFQKQLGGGARAPVPYTPPAHGKFTADLNLKSVITLLILEISRTRKSRFLDLRVRFPALYVRFCKRKTSLTSRAINL